MVPRGWSEDPSIDPKVAECLHISQVFERASEFDVIHNSFDFLPLTYSGLVSTPVVTTIHGFSSPQIVPVFAKYNQSTFYVAISDADRHPALDYVATIHHGIDDRQFHLQPDGRVPTWPSSDVSTRTREWSRRSMPPKRRGSRFA